MPTETLSELIERAARTRLDVLRAARMLPDDPAHAAAIDAARTAACALERLRVELTDLAGAEMEAR